MNETVADLARYKLAALKLCTPSKEHLEKHCMFGHVD